jgi:SNF2 family DNA or RNA helicase
LARGVFTDTLMGETSAVGRSWSQDAFKNGTLPVLVCQIIAAGTAIDLSAASHGYFLELDWVPGNNMQAANRLVSMMKDEPVTFDVCTAPGTIDDRVQRILLRRSQELRTML